MAVAFVRSHAAEFVKAAGLSDAYATTALVPAGNVLVAALVHDNYSTASQPTVSSITKPASETASWVFLGRATYPNAATAGGFANGELWAIKTTVDWPNATSLTVTYSQSITMKAQNILEFSGAEAVLRSTVGTAYSTTTTAASATSTGTSPAVGDLAVGLLFGSNVAAAQSGDIDTTGGSWSSAVGLGSTGGSAATNNFGITQYKILTAASHQTFNSPAAMTAGNGSIVAILKPTIDPLVTQAAYRFYADGTESGSTALAAQDTAPTVDVSSGDVPIQIRTRLQETAGGTLPATDDWQLQWEKNASGSWATVLPASSALALTYESANQNTIYSTGGAGTLPQGVAQSFNGNGGRLTRVGFFMSKTGAPTGSVSAQVYAHSGTFGVDGVPTGSALATSTNSFVPGDFSGTLAWFYFDFAGTFTLASGTDYFIVVSPTTVAGSGNTYNIAVDTTSATGSGNAALSLGSGWSGQATWDFVYELYAQGSTVLPYDSANLTDAAATTNRLTGGTGTFTAGKVSEDGLADDVGWPVVAIADQYDQSNYSTDINMLTPDSGAHGESFIGNGQSLVQAGFYLSKAVVGNGTVTAELYAHTGTYGSSGTPVGAPLAVSTNNFAVSTLGTGAWYDFTFSGATLTAGTPYFIVARTTNTVSSGCRAQGDNTAPTHSGNSAYDATGAGSWVVVARDLIFRVYTTTAVGGFTELLYSLTLKQADLSDADTLRFRTLRNGATASMTYTQTPTINVTKDSGGPATQQATVALTATSTLTVTAVVGKPKIETLTDTFDTTVDKATKWSASSTQVVWDASGQAKIPSSSSYYSLSTPTAGSYDLTGSKVYAKVTPPTGGTRESFMEILRGGVSNDKLSMFVSGTSFAARRIVSGSATAAGSATYNASTHAWWCIRESGGTIYFDYSADGLSWNNLGSTTVAWDITNVWLNINTGWYTTDPGAADAYVDNVNVPPVIVTQNATAALIATSTLSTTGTAFHVLAGSVALTATSTLTVTALRTPQAAVALTSTSTLTATAVRSPQAGVSLTAASTLTADATVTAAPVITAAAALTATSTLTAPTERTVIPAVSLSAVSTLNAVGTAFHVLAGAVPLTATFTLTAIATRDVPSVVPLSATSTLTATATQAGMIAGAVALTATSTLTVSAVREPQGSAPLTATSTLTATAVRGVWGGPTLTAVSTLTATAFRVNWVATTPLTATSTLTVGALREPQGSAALTATSTLTSTALVIPPILASAPLTATSTLTATAVREPQASIPLTATSTLTATAVGLGVLLGSAALAATSTLTVGAVVTEFASVPLTATSTLTATAVRGPQASIPLVATSTLVATGVRTATLAATLTATSTLGATAIGIGILLGSAALVGASTLTATAIREVLPSASLAATSTLTVTGVRKPEASVSLTAVSTLTVGSVRVPQASIPLTATSTLTATAIGIGVVVGAVSLTASATLVATGTRITSTTVTMTATAVLTVSGVPVRIASVSLSSTSTLTATSKRQQFATVSLSSTSLLTAQGFAVKVSAVPLTAVGILTATAAAFHLTVVPNAAGTGVLWALDNDDWHPVGWPAPKV